MDPKDCNPLIKSLSKSGNFAGLEKLYDEATGTKMELFRREQIHASIIDACILSRKLEGLDAACRILLRRNDNVLIQKQSPRIAGLVPEDVLTEFTRNHCCDSAYRELLAVLVQDRVVRGINLNNDESAQTLWLQLKEAGHPLAGLSLSRLPLESETNQRQYTDSGSSHSLAGAHAHNQSSLPLADMPAPKILFEKLPADESELARSFEHGWVEDSNGMWQAGVFKATHAITNDPAKLNCLRFLPLACLKGHEQKSLLSPISANQAFAEISSPSNGGAYSHPRPAYGRLHAWKSLNALTATQAETMALQAADAEKCRWFSLSSSSKWFYSVAWDQCIICLRPDGKTVAVVAATDTD